MGPCSLPRMFMACNNCIKSLHSAVPMKTIVLLGKVGLYCRFTAGRKREAVVPAEGICRLARLLEQRANNLSREMEGKCTDTSSIFLNRLMKSNQLTSLHAFSNLSQSKTKRQTVKKGGKEIGPLRYLWLSWCKFFPLRSPEAASLHCVPYPWMYNVLGKPIQMPAGRDEWLITVLTMKGAQQLSEGLSPKRTNSTQDTLPKKNVPRASWELATPFIPLSSLFVWLFFPWCCDTFFSSYHLQSPPVEGGKEIWTWTSGSRKGWSLHQNVIMLWSYSLLFPRRPGVHLAEEWENCHHHYFPPCSSWKEPVYPALPPERDGN